MISESMWIDECNDLIRSCGTLLGIQKSFSTSDITIHNKNEQGNHSLRHAVSEFALNSIQNHQNARLSRSYSRYSTWVSVGDHPSQSQLPSPHGGVLTLTSSSQQQLSASNLISAINPAAQPFTASDLIKSMNKKVRECYIRSRLLTTHRAIERLSQSEFNLDQLSIAITTGPGPTELSVPELIIPDACAETNTNNQDFRDNPNTLSPVPSDTHKNVSASKLNRLLNRNLTIHDIEKEKGRPLSKYDRNMMIFNWLHSLDETATAEE